MRRLILKMSVTVDGFICGPNGEIDWLFKTLDEEVSAWIADTLWQAGTHIMGRKTFHDMRSYWPKSSDILAAPMNEIPKIVFSKKGFIEKDSKDFTTQALKDSPTINLTSSTNSSFIMSSWNDPMIVSGDLVHEISKLKQQVGKDILAHGGASFVQSLVTTGLIDEYRLLIHPVVIGKGLSMFSELMKYVNLQLEETTPFKNGAIAQVYKPL